MGEWVKGVYRLGGGGDVGSLSTLRIKVSIVPPLRGCKRYATGVNGEEDEDEEDEDEEEEEEEEEDDKSSEEAEAEAVGGGVRAVLMVSMSAS